MFPRGVAQARNRVFPVSFMVAIWRQAPKPDVNHAVTVSTGIRMSRPGWNAMKPGIDGVNTHWKSSFMASTGGGPHDQLRPCGH
jgi:hypothetical protein